MSKKFFTAFVAVALVLCSSVLAFADTIHLKDGSVIHGQVISFKDQQFTVLIGNGAGGRRSRVTLYMEDVESIDFDSATNAAASAITNDDYGSTGRNSAPPIIRPSRPTSTPPDNQQNDNISTTPQQTSTLPASRTSPTFQISAHVRGDNTANGWTNTGLVVRRGQRLRVTASGRVNLGANRYSTPGGIATFPDKDKLMRNEPTGALIAVIGDDNDDFILIGAHREFVAQRDGVLFLGVNEGNLSDNTGAYDVVIEAEAVNGTR